MGQGEESGKGDLRIACFLPGVRRTESTASH